MSLPHIFIPSWLEPYIVPVILIAFLAIPGLVLSQQIHSYERDQEMQQAGIKSIGKVDYTRFDCIDDDCIYYMVTYEYVVDGRMYRKENELIQDYKPGDYLYNSDDTVEIIYLPSDPSYSEMVDDLDYQHDQDWLVGVLGLSVLMGIMLGSFWKPYRDYTFASWRGNAFFHFRYTVTYTAIFAIIGIALLSYENGDSMLIHMFWFGPVFIAFGVPWIEIRRSGKPKDAPELRREGYQGGSIQRIAFELAFPAFLALYTTILAVVPAIRDNNLNLGIYVGIYAIISAIMMGLWKFPLFLFWQLHILVQHIRRGEINLPL